MLGLSAIVAAKIVMVSVKFGILPSSSANAERWLTLSNSPVHQRTRHQDHRRRRSESRFYASIYLHRCSGRLMHRTGGIPDVDSTRFTMDEVAPCWMGPTLIIDSSTTDGPQQDTLTTRRTSLTLASLRQARTSQGAEEVRKTRRPRNSSDQGGHRWGRKEWFHSYRPHLKSFPILPSRRCTEAKEEQEDYCSHQASSFDHSWNGFDFVGWEVQGKEGCFLEAAGEWTVVGYWSFQDQRCPSATGKPGVRYCYLHQD